jgi:hypothetical protein
LIPNSAYISKLIIGGIFLIPLFSACSSGSKQKEHPLKTQINSQIERSAEIPDLTFQKSIIDLKTEPSTREDSLLEADIVNLIKNEVSYAYEYYYQDPLSSEYLEIDQRNDTTIATLPPENDNKLELKRQKILWDANEENVLYLESRVFKKSWLYTLEIDISVKFDSTGKYQEHQMHLSNKVPLISSGIDAIVEGKLIYP